jgi:hypothetical protein
MENKMQPAEIAERLEENARQAKNIIDDPATFYSPRQIIAGIKHTKAEYEAFTLAAEIIRNHDIVRCGECIYHHEIPCPVDIDMDTPTPDDWYCPCGVKMDGERKDGVEK